MSDKHPSTMWLAGDETRKALEDIGIERVRQDQKWGVQRHGFPVWLTVLMEEVGELAHETLLFRERSGHAALERESLELMRAEAVQVAAVAVAMIEQIDEVLADD